MVGLGEEVGEGAASTAGGVSGGRFSTGKASRSSAGVGVGVGLDVGGGAGLGVGISSVGEVSIGAEATAPVGEG